MRGNFKVVAQLDDDIFFDKKYDREDKEYIKKRIYEFDWKSLQRLPNPGETITFMGALHFMVTVKEIWTWHTANDGYYKYPGLLYTVFIDEIEILEDHRQK